MVEEQGSDVPFRSQWILRLLHERGDGMVGLGSEHTERLNRLEQMGLVEIVNEREGEPIYARITDAGNRYVQRLHSSEER